MSEQEMTTADKVLVAVKRILNEAEYRRLVKMGERQARRYWALVRVRENGNQLCLKFGPFPTPYYSVVYRKRLVGRIAREMPDVIDPFEIKTKGNATPFIKVNYSVPALKVGTRWVRERDPDDNDVARAARERTLALANRDDTHK